MGKIVTFYGADHKAGTTMITHSIARKLAECDRKKEIVVLCMDGNTGQDYIEKNSNGIDRIRAALVSEVLTVEEIKENCLNEDNLYFLKGADSLAERKSYDPEMVKKLFSIIKNSFEYILADAGASAYLGLTIGSLLYSDFNVLITTQQKTAFENFIKKDNQILGPLTINFEYVIVNKFAYGRFLPAEAELIKKYSAAYEKTFFIPMSEYGWQAEKDTNTLLSYKEKDYISGITDIAETVFLRQVVKKKRFSFFKKKEAKKWERNLS